MDITDKIKKDKAMVKKLMDKRKDIDEKIKELSNVIEKNEMLLNNEKFNEATKVMNSKGFSLEELLSAVKNGDLTSLQDKIENAEKEEKDKEEMIKEENKRY